MTPERMRAIRQRLDMTQDEMGEALRLRGKTTNKTIRRWEDGTVAPPGPVTLLYEAVDDGRIVLGPHGNGR